MQEMMQIHGMKHRPILQVEMLILGLYKDASSSYLKSIGQSEYYRLQLELFKFK